MKLVNRETLRKLPLGTCFFLVRCDGIPVWSEFNVISSQPECGFIGVLPIAPYYSKYELMEKGTTKADNETIDTRYWNYGPEEYFAVLDQDDLESMKEAINYALARRI